MNQEYVKVCYSNEFCKGGVSAIPKAATLALFHSTQFKWTVNFSPLFFASLTL